MRRRKSERYPGFAKRLTRELMNRGYMRQNYPGRVAPDVARLARELRATPKQVYRWIAGESFPDTYINRICALLGIPKDQLLQPEPLPLQPVRKSAPVQEVEVVAVVAGWISPYPQVDAMVAFCRGELLEMWEKATEEERAEIMSHLRNQFSLIRRLLERHPPPNAGMA